MCALVWQSTWKPRGVRILKRDFDRRAGPAVVAPQINFESQHTVFRVFLQSIVVPDYGLFRCDEIGGFLAVFPHLFREVIGVCECGLPGRVAEK